MFPRSRRTDIRFIPRENENDDEELSSKKSEMSTQVNAVDLTTIPRPVPRVFQPRIMPVGGASVTIKDGMFILTDGKKIAASQKAIKLREEWKQGLKKVEQEMAARARKKQMGQPVFVKEDVGHEPEHYVPPALPDDENELFCLGNTTETGPQVDEFMEQTVKIDYLDNEEVRASKPVNSVDDTSADLPPQLVSNLKRMGITDFLPIQRHVIPIVQRKFDIIGCAPTGTGKTAAFLIPIIQALYLDKIKSKLLRSVQNPRALILVPSRELAMQMRVTAAQIAYGTGITTFALYGAIDSAIVRNNLSADVLVATPGRMMEVVTKQLVKLSGLMFIVVDEADRMFLKSFPEVNAILEDNSLRRKDMRQTMFFSATVPYHQIPFLRRHQHRPVSVKIGSDGPVSGVKHSFERTVGYDEMIGTLRKILDTAAEEGKTAIVFARAISMVDRLARDLRYANVATIHGDMTQENRKYNLDKFLNGESIVLLATDVASRGLDIPEVGLIVNFSLPRSIEDYIHRVGRTARKGHVGCAISLIDPTHKRDSCLIVPLVSMLQERKEIKVDLPRWLVDEAERRNPHYLPNETDPPSDAEDLADFGIFVNAAHYTERYGEWPVYV